MWLYLMFPALLLIWRYWKTLLFFLSIGFICYINPFLYIFYLYWYTDRSRVCVTQDIWSQVSCWVCNLTLVKLPDSVPVQVSRRTILLGNHRSIVDFFMHDVVTEFTGNFLSRALVGILFFPLALITYYENTVWFFVRGFVKQDPERFYRWIDEKWRCPRNIRTNLLLYPEGHRNQGPTPLRIRSGMIRYAYSRVVPVQIFITGGYDGVLDERKCETDLRSRRVLYKVYSPIDPRDFSTENAFVQHVEQRFTECFKEVFDKVAAEEKGSS